MKRWLVCILPGLFVYQVSAQLNVTSNNTATQLAQIIAGQGVTISNATTNCQSDNINGAASGSFSCTSCNLGLDSGIILTTGYAVWAEGPNNTDVSQPWGVNPGDPNIAALIGLPASELWDPCVLEFDLEALGDSLQFQYVFGSEEYPDYACTTFNDAFGFFISGPGITGTPDIALVPGTNTPVTINTINGGPGYQTINFGNSCVTTYPQYYINNGTSDDAYGNDIYSPPNSTSSYYIQYNGFTTVLTATIGGLQPCQIYHLKLAIDDVGDDQLDSGVFIEAGSLTSNSVKLDAPYTNPPRVPDAVRNCVDGIFPFQFSHPVGRAATVHFTIAGTAVNGTDYTAIADSVVFNPGDSIENVVIQPIGTSVNDTETVKLYLYTLCDANNPYDSATMYILNSINLQVTPSNATICPGDTVQLLATGGVNYTWAPTSGLDSANVAGPVANPATSTIYICSTSIGTCTQSDSVHITVLTNPPFSVIAGPNDTDCTGNPIQLSATVNGNPVNGHPFVYTWTPATGLSNPNILNPIVNPSSTAEYVIRVSSGNCEARDSLNVILDNISAGTAETNSSCFNSGNGTATINVNGAPPYTYHWNDGQTTQTATGLIPGIYTVSSSDSTGCSVSASVAVGGPLPVYFNAPAISNVVCNGQGDGSITETASGGAGNFSYVWSNSDTTSAITNLVPGAYTVTATDANSCSSDTTMNISQPQPLQLADTLGNITCFGIHNGSIRTGASGGTPPYRFAWSPAAGGATSAAISNLNPGTYSLTVTDFNHCEDSASFSLTGPAQIVLSTAVVNVSCFGLSDGSITLTVNGGTPGYRYQWTGGSTAQNPGNLAAGTYAVTVTDNNFCTSSTNAVINQPAAAFFNAPVVQPISCFGGDNGSVALSASGGSGSFSYAWSNGSVSDTASGLSAGVAYTETATDANGCSIDTAITLTSPTAVVISSPVVSNVTCFGDSDGMASVTASGGASPYTYNWSNNDSGGTISKLIANSYNVTATDASGCTASTVAVIIQPNPLLLSIDSVTGPTCTYTSDGYLDAAASGGTPPYNFNLSTGGNSIENNNTGYFNNLAAGNYTVLLTDSANCTASAPATLPAALPNLFNITSDPISCYGSAYADGSIHITALTLQNAPFYYSVDGGNEQYDGDFYNLAAGTYSIIIRSFNNCITDTFAIVVQPAEGIADVLPSDTTLRPGQTIQLNAQLSPYADSAIVSYAWSPAQGLSCVDCPAPVVNTYNRVNDYTVIITYNKTCTAAASATVIVEGPEPVFIPNAFTPNGDGVNDVFTVYGSAIKTVALKVFDRWGEKVFDSQSQFVGWDGYYRGVLQEPGVYVYEAQITFLDNTVTLRTGSVTLIR